jgi:two-component system copper resistance phosphate regulon response regulator CusR
MRILLAEDEPDAARMLAKGLREQGFAVDIAADGDAAFHDADVTDYDALILDVMLPSRSGVSVCRALRAGGMTTPILMLTARDAIEARVEGLDAGADDYLVKPFAFEELLARLRAIIRRGVRPLMPEQIDAGDLVLDTRARRAALRGEPVSLTAREYALLEHLARRAGEVVGRAEIAEHVWDASYDPFSNVIDVYIQRLRRKLGDAGGTLIETRRGEGYQLAKPRERTP